MKISELKNAPEWLVLAKTENADVELTKVWWSDQPWVIWNGGNFLGGDFLGGNFLGSNFLGGLMMPHCKWIYGQDCYGNIIIGCKRKKINEWEEWFAGTEEFSTKRGTEEFKKIQACFEATKAYLKFMNN